jgi:hypothetical protein
VHFDGTESGIQPVVGVPRSIEQHSNNSDILHAASSCGLDNTAQARPNQKYTACYAEESRSSRPPPSYLLSLHIASSPASIRSGGNELTTNSEKEYHRSHLPVKTPICHPDEVFETRVGH